jgi:hypothetical protein
MGTEFEFDEFFGGIEEALLGSLIGQVFEDEH